MFLSKVEASSKYMLESKEFYAMLDNCIKKAEQLNTTINDSDDVGGNDASEVSSRLEKIWNAYFGSSAADYPLKDYV